ncbi:cell division protein DedD [Microbulbifer aggregans]|uniref:Cell division protein DedD n=1 Tax=Microbulbifer aggregans TaxID=1769779 RepID=A0A1C9WBT5_9GAMM|nr:SPOR domain-containing protein [Microbulbifer aggregans]AOS98600.1 cell division protein DedD [Microbulbifer aggregans]
MASRNNDLSSTGRLNDGFKQRIVGALVLVALAVIFLPSLFDREGARYIDITSKIPPAPDIQPIEIAQPQPAQDVAPAPEPEAVFQPVAVTGQSTAVEPKPEPREASQSAAAAQTETEAAKPAPVKREPVLDERGLPRSWVVQVASYREQVRADRLRDRLMDEGFKAYTRSASTDKGTFVRVYVGPKVDRADAEATKQELDQLLAAQTLVMRLK